MPLIDQAVTFLKDNNALELGGSPWPTHEEGEEVLLIDWERLAPPRLEDRDLNNESPYESDWGWRLPISSEDESQLRDALGRGSPIVPNNGQVDVQQWDIDAWYQPIHFFGYDWGIFIRDMAVRRTAFMIARFVPHSALSMIPLKELWKVLIRASLYSYFLHEHYHHKVECLGFRLHVAQRVSSYLPYKRNVYAATRNTDDQLEEALANADCYRRLRTRPYSMWLTQDVVEAVRAYLLWQFQFAPPGYRMAGNYISNPGFGRGENILQTQVREASLTPAQPSRDWNLAPRMTQSFFPVTSNIWTVVTKGSSTLLPTKPIAPIRTLSTSDAIKLLSKVGYRLVHGGKGSHVKLEKSGVRPMILRGNCSELSPGNAKNVLRVLGDYNLHDLQGLLRGDISL